MKKITFVLLTAFFISCGESNTDQPAEPTADTSGNTTVALPDTTVTKTDTTGSSGALATYVCPPCECGKDDTVYTKPGVCPACNMALVAKPKAKL